ncbi:MAG TPA: ATP-binding protein [Syntrophomonas sp.]|jgi:flagellar biosynthesis protein FlhG|nr:ATP-binding protein [Syntrophomonas sp.]
MNNQADKLRQMALDVKNQIEKEMAQEFKHTRVIVIASGKGGVGKSTLALNISLSLCNRGKKVILMDADLGLANIDIMLGLLPKYNLHHMIQGKKNLKDIIISGPGGLSIIAGGSGITELANLGDNSLKKLLVELGKLDGEYDYMMIDTGAGISKNVISFLLSANDIIFVTTPEPTSMTDAYGMVKTIARKSTDKTFYLIVNRVVDNIEGILVAEKFKLVCEKFLNLHINILGYVVNEPLIGEGIKRQSAFIDIFPRSQAAKNINNIASNLISSNDKSFPRDSSGGGIKRFFKKIIGMA